ncbi:MAG TPA: DUF2844 domain-containing protein [Candidatus Binatia bacterium]|nr:DUF2844 domain-containing protein [Candidatus Binatia bacterium]
MRITSHLTAAIAVLMVSAPAWAALGGSAASVQDDRAHLQGTLRTTAAQMYTVNEIQTQSGTRVREYVSSEGTVFAVSWRGPWPPDMRQLLGNYYQQFAHAAQNSPRAGRRPLVIEQDGFVLQFAGHPRAFMGKAYIPQMMPQGVRAEDIQ